MAEVAGSSLNGKLIEIVEDPSRIDALTRDDARSIFVEVKTLGARLELRLFEPAAPSTGDEILSVREAARYTGMSEAFIYAHAPKMTRASLRAGRSWRFRRSLLVDDLARLRDHADEVEFPRAPSVDRRARRIRSAGVR